MAAARIERQDLLAQAQAAASDIDETLRVSPFARAITALEADEGSDARSRVLRELLSNLVQANKDKIDSLNYPASVRALIHTEFDRIERQCSRKQDEWFDFERFPLRCDYRIVCFGRIPVGPQHLEIGGLPRSLVYRGGLGQSFRFLRTVLQAGGRKPFYVLHLAGGIWPPAFLFTYSAEAQFKMFHNIAACLEMNPECRGVSSGGWLFDPQLDLVAPHLSYLRKGWIDNGATLFYWERNEYTTHLATANSRHRKRLYEEGEYMPCSYMVVWPRDSLLAWAQRENALFGSLL